MGLRKQEHFSFLGVADFPVNFSGKKSPIILANPVAVIYDMTRKYFVRISDIEYSMKYPSCLIDNIDSSFCQCLFIVLLM